MAKDGQRNHQDISGGTGLVGKTITTVNCWTEGIVVICEIGFSGGTTLIKSKGLQVEFGGTTTWGSGTMVIS